MRDRRFVCVNEVYMDVLSFSVCTMCRVFFFFKQKTAYEMRISDWSSDVCSSDLLVQQRDAQRVLRRLLQHPHPCCRRGRAPFAIAQLVQEVLAQLRDEIGRASCRVRVCQYVEISVVAVSLKKKLTKHIGVSTTKYY